MLESSPNALYRPFQRASSNFQGSIRQEDQNPASSDALLEYIGFTNRRSALSQHTGHQREAPWHEDPADAVRPVSHVSSLLFAWLFPSPSDSLVVLGDVKIGFIQGQRLDQVRMFGKRFHVSKHTAL
jgi:hypothetical protein